MNRREREIDPRILLDGETVRMNLMLAGLFLTAFEILKAAVIEGLKSHLVRAQELPGGDFQDLVDSLGKETASSLRDTFQQDVARYEQELGIRFEQRMQTGLLPSAQHLSNSGVLTDDDCDEIRRIRDHRNEISHELPQLLIATDSGINVSFLPKVRDLVRKVDAHWARLDLLFDLQTGDEVDVGDLPDDAILSSRVLVIDRILAVVEEHLGSTDGY